VGDQDTSDGTLASPFIFFSFPKKTQSKDTSLPYKGIADAFVRIVRNETWHGLYRGLGPSLLGVSHVAVQFPLYEYLKTHFTHKGKGKRKRLKGQ